MTPYPPRSSHFAHKTTRLLLKSCACQSIGHHAALLVIHICHTEDAARYQGPVRFWNSQLMETLGFTSPKQLADARRKAIESGWLHYERQGTRAVGHYWVTVPSNVTEFTDEPIEESDGILSAGGTNQDGILSQNGTNKSAILSAGGTNCGTNPGTNCGKLSNPTPNPDPKGESASADPLSADLKEFFDGWSQCGLTECRKLTTNRKKALKSRLADPDWRSSWREALDRAAKSSFCRGQNDRGWKADVDWFLKPDSVVKLLEGKYDDGKTAAPNPEVFVPRLTKEQKAYLEEQRRASLAAEDDLQKESTL